MYRIVKNPDFPVHYHVMETYTVIGWVPAAVCPGKHSIGGGEHRTITADAVSQSQKQHQTTQQQPGGYS